MAKYLSVKQALMLAEQLGYERVRRSKHYILIKGEKTLTLPHTGNLSSWLSHQLIKEQRTTVDTT